MAEEQPRGQILSTFKEGEGVPAQYRLVRTGDTGLSRLVRKRTLDSGRNVIELKYWATKRHCKVIGNYVPQDVIEEASRDAAASKEKQARSAENKMMKEKRFADEVFKKVYPSIPIDIRDAIFDHAFEKGSGRVGTSKDLDMETKVKYATEYHVLYNRTGFEAEFESEKDKLYAKLEKKLAVCQFRDSRDDAYENFYAARDELEEELKSKYFPRAIEIANTWKV